MLYVWLGVIAALLIQESISTAAMLAAALRLGLNIWVIHGIWLAATVGETAIGYVVGGWLRRHYGDSRVGRWAERIARDIGRTVGARGERFFLFSLAFLLYTWMAGFVAAWMGISLEVTLVFIVLGNLAWYGLVWGTALGVNAVSPNFITVVIMIVAFGVALTVATAVVQKSQKKKHIGETKKE
jgi:hypothetical protein